jgi:hypothetical protein
MSEEVIDTPHKNNFNYMSILPSLNTEIERKEITETVKPPEVIVGSTAFNVQVEYPFLQKRPFTDIDIKSPTNKETALKVERKLDRMAGMNNYYITKVSDYKAGTYRVHSRSRNTIVSDVAKKDKPVPYVMINNTPYETMQHREKEVRRLLRTPSAEYRREKDLKMLGYIERYKKFKKHTNLFKVKL